MDSHATWFRPNRFQFGAIYRVALSIAFADLVFMQTANFLDIGAGGSDVLLAASKWIEGVILGTVGTVIAMVAVAGLGFVLLTGQMTVRTALRVTMGCFLLFGAQAISRGMSGMTQFGSPRILQPQPAYVGPEAPAQPPQPVPRQANPFDPYTAGSNADKG